MLARVTHDGRRGVLLYITVVTLLYFVQRADHPAAAVEADPRVDLSLSPKVGTLQRIKAVYELQGELNLKTEGNQPVQTPVQVRAELSYDEKVLAVDGPARRVTRAVRQYEAAAATIGYRQGSVRPQLRDDRRLIVVAADGPGHAVLFSPQGPLDGDELELLDVPGNSVLLGGLLPQRVVAVGATWEVDPAALTTLVGLDVVLSGSLKCQFERLEGASAIIHIQGQLHGSADGVSSDQGVTATLRFDTRTQRITWFAMSLKEKRAVGHAHPGLEATARVQMVLQDAAQVPALHDKILADLDLDPTEPALLLEFRSEAGGFGLLLDRRWQVLIERDDVSILRLVDRGDLIAQFNISPLPPLESGETFSIVDFQQDIQRALQDRFGEFVTASETKTDTGLHVMRVVTTGMVDNLPIDWVYYHLTGDRGQRVSCVCTSESSLSKQLGAADQALVSSFHFLTSPDRQPAHAMARRPVGDAP